MKNLEMATIGFCSALDDPINIFEQSKNPKYSQGKPEFIKWLNLSYFLLVQPFKWTQLKAFNAFFDRDCKTVADFSDTKSLGFNLFGFSILS